MLERDRKKRKWKKENETQKVSIHRDGEEEMDRNMSRRGKCFIVRLPEEQPRRRRVDGRGGRSLGGVMEELLYHRRWITISSVKCWRKFFLFNPQISLPGWRAFNLDAEPLCSVISCFRLQLMIPELAEVEIQILSEAFCLLSVFSPWRPWDQFVTLLFWQSLVFVHLMSRYEYKLLFFFKLRCL